MLIFVQVRGNSARAAAPAGDYPRALCHGQGAPRHVLQVHRRIQTSQDHHLQVIWDRKMEGERGDRAPSHFYRRRVQTP